jgi:glucose-1-phosphate thymidylyltransferase
MKAIILAAGYATRMYPLTKDLPKALLPVKGKFVLDYLLDDIKEFKIIDEFVIITNHKFVKQFQDYINDKDYKITVIDDGSDDNENRLGAVGDISFAIKTLNIEDDVLVIASDNLLNFSLEFFVKGEINTSRCMYYKLDDLSKAKRTGIITIDEDGYVSSMEEKPENPKSNYAVPPFYLYAKKDLKYLIDNKDLKGLDSPGNFLAYLAKKEKVKAYLMPGERIDIGNIETYNKIK